jgi:CheY-like chemotaxis protein
VSNRLSFLQIIRRYAARFAGRVPPRPLRILVVDDEEPIRRYVDRVMREAGHETALACDGPEAIEVARTFQPLDLLLTDVLMPQMSGVELARRLRQTEPGLKVLYLTGFSDSLFKERVTLWEDEAYLDKPCSVKALLQVVSLLTSGRLTAASADSKAVKPKSASATAV